MADDKKARTRKKIINTAVEISENPPTNKETAFLNKHLVQANLPHSKPKKDVWQRKNGNLTLTVQAGINHETGESYGLPYGSLPRLGLLFIVTKAVQTKSRRIELGSTLNDFMRQLGLNPDTGGGKRGDAKRLIEQMKRLLNAHFTFNETMTDAKGREGHKWLNMEVSKRGELWWDVKTPDQADIFGSWIELGETFFEAITSSPVPLDFRAAVALKQSPLAVDCYILLCYEAFKTQKIGKSRFIPYASLYEQMGTEYATIKDFKRYFRTALRKARTVAPTIHIEEENGGICFIPDSLPPVNPKIEE